MIAITKRQRALLDFIRKYMAENDGLAPTVMEMAQGLGLSAKSNAQSMLTRLEQRGVIRRLKFQARAIQIIDPNDPVARASDRDLVAELTQRGWTVTPPFNPRVPHGGNSTSQVQHDHG